LESSEEGSGKRMKPEPLTKEEWKKIVNEVYEEMKREHGFGYNY